MRFSRRALLIASLGLAGAMPAFAVQGVKFSPAALSEAQKSGKPVLVEVSAPWCPTCRAQQPILGKLLGSGKFTSFVKLDVDFDSQKDDLRALRVQQQSTLIVYKGDKEVGRSTGDTNAQSIEALLAKAL